MSGEKFAINCGAHPSKETWIVCTHLDRITRARRVSGCRAGETGDPVGIAVTGDALCPDCDALVNAGRSLEAELVIACGACVRDRWPLEGAS